MHTSGGDVHEVHICLESLQCMCVFNKIEQKKYAVKVTVAYAADWRCSLDVFMYNFQVKSFDAV